jgi:hypothetical protein
MRRFAETPHLRLTGFLLSFSKYLMLARRFIAGWCVVVFLITRSLVLGDETEQVRSLCAEWARANNTWQHEISAATTPQEREALKVKNPDLEFAPRFLRLAEGMDTNSDAAAEALVYATCADRNGPIGDQAANLLARDHVNSRPLELLFN